MLKRALSLALAVLIPLTTACSTLETREYAPGEIPLPDSDHRIVGVTRTSGEQVSFDPGIEGRPALAAWMDREAVVGPVNGQPVRVSLSAMRSASVEENEPHLGRTLLLVGGVGAAAVLIVGLLTFNMDINLGGGGY